MFTDQFINKNLYRNKDISTPSNTSLFYFCNILQNILQRQNIDVLDKE